MEENLKWINVFNEKFDEFIKDLIQTFPDEYIFMGANNSWYKQIGNAVPVKLAEIIAKEIMELI